MKLLVILAASLLVGCSVEVTHETQSAAQSRHLTKETTMTNLLHIDASPRGERSHTRRLTAEFVGEWRKAYPLDAVTYRDIGRNPIPHVTCHWAPKTSQSWAR